MSFWINTTKTFTAKDLEKHQLKTLGIVWLVSTYAYEEADSPLIPDGDWDQLTKYLYSQYHDFDPYLKWAIPKDCLEASTGSGVNWNFGLPAIVRKDFNGELNQSEIQTKKKQKSEVLPEFVLEDANPLGNL